MIKVKIEKNKNLRELEKNIINKNRIKEFGRGAIMDFKRDYEPDTEWFFVGDEGKVVALGGLRPITIDYLGKKYKIMGICSIISIIKGKGHGKILIKSMIGHLRKKGKTGLGFTVETKFFGKAGLKTKKGFIKRFRYKNPKTGKIEIDNEGDGIYYDGKDNFIKKVLSSKSLVYIDIPFW